MHWQRFALIFLLSLILAACGEQDRDGGETASAPAVESPDEPEQAAAAPEEDTAAPEEDTPADEPAPEEAEPRGTLDRVKSALAGDHRSEDQRARDQYRNPAATLAFFGLEPDMTVVELWPGGGGWYTAVLAPVLRDQGRLITAGYLPDSEVEYYRRNQAAYEEKLAADPDVYDQVEVIPFLPPEHASLGEPGSADMVLTFRNLHNWHGQGVLGDVFRSAHEVLKPGGVFGVVEHRARAGASIEETEESGYMPEDYVISLAEEVGFELDASSDVNANPADTADHPAGVWTLPPTLRQCREMQEGAAKSACMEKYRRIGESDRMTLKFVKPEATE